MEKSPSWQSLPPESTERSALLIFFTSLVCVCVALFGERLPALYLGIPGGCTLLLAAMLRLQRRTNTGKGFALDDEAQSINPCDSSPIPFSAITSLRLILYRDRACAYAMTGLLHRRKCLACIPRGQDQSILQALRNRSFAVKISKNPFKKRTAEILPLIIMPLLAGALLYVNVDMFRKAPCLALPPQELSVQPFSPRAHNKLHRLGQISCALPKQYRLLRQEEHSTFFYNPEGAVRLTISSGPPRESVPHTPLTQTVTKLLGYGNDYEAAVLAVRSRFGLIPALIKSALLQRYNTSTVQIFKVSTDQSTGIMLRGEQYSQEENNPGNMPDQVTEIMLHSAGKNLVIRILIASHLPLDIEHIEGLIAGIH